MEEDKIMIMMTTTVTTTTTMMIIMADTDQVWCKGRTKDVGTMIMTATIIVNTVQIGVNHSL